jgi:schlafen family protein
MASPRVQADEHLHLAVSMRSFRAEALSDLIGHLVDNEADQARAAFARISEAYPIVVTRDLHRAKNWLKTQARGTERFGLVASSGAQRLRPAGIHIKAAIEPPNWFLNDAKDVRSSYYLEEVASEFDVQGLELDWAGVCWDGDFHHDGKHWISQAFKGSKWQLVNDASRRLYLKNAYRVILTRARQGMVIFVPAGDTVDWTRPATYYDGTCAFLTSCGIKSID